MPATRAKCSIPPSELTFPILSAAVDWITWRDDYEHEGVSRDLPLLRCEGRYKKFIRNYRPFRQRRGMAVKLAVRDALLRDAVIDGATIDDSGQGVERAAQDLAGEFKDLGVPRSAISKLAMFLQPERFAPWDNFARRGIAALNRKSGRRIHPATYDRYLADFQHHWRTSFREPIERALKTAGPLIPNHRGFGLRVFDWWLMKRGGRWGK